MMKVIGIDDPSVEPELLAAVASGVAMVQCVSVFALLAAPTRRGIARLSAVKERRAGKVYGSVLGDWGPFRRLLEGGQWWPELDPVRDVFLRARVAGAPGDSEVFRGGTHQALCASGRWGELFAMLEGGLAADPEPSLWAGHRYSAPVGSSANLSGDPRGSIVDRDRALAFARERGIPLVVTDRMRGPLGSTAVAELVDGQLVVRREGPGLELSRAAGPAA